MITPFRPRKTLSLLALLLSMLTRASAQGPDPVSVAKMIYSHDAVPDLAKYVRKDYTGGVSREALRGYEFSHFLLLNETPEKAVVALQISDSSSIENAYAYFEKKQVWQLYDLHVFGLPPFATRIVAAYEKLSQAEVDSIIKKAKNDRVNEFPFHSQEQFDNRLAAGRLMTGTDDSIIKHFTDHEAEFERLKNLYVAALGKRFALGTALRKSATAPPPDSWAFYLPNDTTLATSNNRDCRNLLLTEISYEGDDYFPNCLDFKIIQMGDNSVGYIFVTTPEDTPPIDPAHLMMIRKIKEGWYMYRTN